MFINFPFMNAPFDGEAAYRSPTIANMSKSLKKGVRFHLRIVLALILVCTLQGCSQSKEAEKLQPMLQQALNFSIDSNFQILDFESTSAVGDYVETYELMVEDTEFSQLLNTVKIDNSWKLLPSGVFLRGEQFKGHGFNGFVAAVDPQSKVIRVQFGWE